MKEIFKAINFKDSIIIDYSVLSKYFRDTMRILTDKKSNSVIQRGATLLIKKPSAYVLKSYYRHNLCDYCFKKE